MGWRQTLRGVVAPWECDDNNHLTARFYVPKFDDSAYLLFFDAGVRLPELREPRALPKWLMQVAHHESYRWKRQAQRVVSRDADHDLPEPEIQPIAEDLVQQTQEEQILREAMATLSPQCRRLVDLLFYEVPAKPYTEVAKELGLAVGSIGFTRQRCIERLRRQLEDLGFS